MKNLNPFFHRLSKKKLEALKKEGRTWGWLMDNYRQPRWCGYPDALEGMMGCWSLIGGHTNRQSDCKHCELNGYYETGDEIKK